MLFFALFTAFGSILFERLLSRLLDESAIEGIGKKVILSILATALVMSYSYHVLPITNLIDPGARIGALFAPQEYFFWWLLLPLVGIMLVF
jgi:hydrogenase-4 membrane subunit HyfE